MIIVAEVGSMHKRNPALLYEMARQCALAGVTHVKMQWGWPKNDEIRYADDMAEDFMEWCDNLGIVGFASIWSHEALGMAESLGVEEYKISHQIYTDPKKQDLVTAIVATGKPTYISGKDIYCEGQYPCFHPSIPQDFNKWFGYSSHTPGIADALIAASRGAEYIEKHVCLDKTDLWTRDTAFAIDMTELRQMVVLAKEIARLR